MRAVRTNKMQFLHGNTACGPLGGRRQMSGGPFLTAGGWADTIQARQKQDDQAPRRHPARGLANVIDLRISEVGLSDRGGSSVSPALLASGLRERIQSKRGRSWTTRRHDGTPLLGPPMISTCEFQKWSFRFAGGHLLREHFRALLSSRMQLLKRSVLRVVHDGTPLT